MVDLIVFADETPESKVAQDLIPFFEAVIEEVARHVPEKGYGYRDSSWADWFIERTLELAKNYNANPSNHGEALDIGAMAGFAWLHQTGRMPSMYAAWESINNGDKRSTP